MAVSGSAPPAGDWGALFGLGAHPPQDLEKNWRWEAPASHIPVIANRPPAAPSGWRWPALGSDPALPNVGTAVEDERLAQFLEILEDPLESSRLAFEDLLNARQHKPTLSIQDVEPLLKFLQSSANEPDAHLTLRFVHWLGQAKWIGDRVVDIKCLQDLANVIYEKLKLFTIGADEVSDVLIQLLRRNDAIRIIPLIVDAFPSGCAEKCMRRVTEHILASHTSRSGRLASMDRWLTCLRSCSFSKGQSHCVNDTWQMIYRALAKYLRPTELASHFAMLEWDDFAMLLLRHWVPGLITATPPMDLDSAKQDADLEILHRGSHKSLRQHPPRDLSIDMEAIEADFKFVRGRRFHQYALNSKKALTDLVAVLARRKLPYAELLSEIFGVYQQTQSPEGARNLFCDLYSNRGCGVPIELATQLVQFFLASGCLKYAFLVFDLVPSVPLSQCYELPLRLIDKGSMSIGKVLPMLNRIAPVDIADSQSRNKPKNTLKQEHVNLVHLVAYACARSLHITNRAAFRRVWECYRFLQDRGAPLSPLMSRAFVKAGLSRPLKQGERVSATKIRYVLGIVERLEGKGMAGRIDELVFMYWQRHWRTFLEAGFRREEELTGQEEKKMEGILRWRMRGWIKRGRGKWFSDEKGRLFEDVERTAAAHEAVGKRSLVAAPTTSPRSEIASETSFEMDEAASGVTSPSESGAFASTDTIMEITSISTRPIMAELIKAPTPEMVDGGNDPDTLAEPAQEDVKTDASDELDSVPFEEIDGKATTTPEQTNTSDWPMGDGDDLQIRAEPMRDDEGIDVPDEPQFELFLDSDTVSIEVRTEHSDNNSEHSHQDGGAEVGCAESEVGTVALPGLSVSIVNMDHAAMNPAVTKPRMGKKTELWRQGYDFEEGASNLPGARRDIRGSAPSRTAQRSSRMVKESSRKQSKVHWESVPEQPRPDFKESLAARQYHQRRKVQQAEAWGSFRRKWAARRKVLRYDSMSKEIRKSA